jgi:hypothetical protein
LLAPEAYEVPEIADFANKKLRGPDPVKRRDPRNELKERSKLSTRYEPGDTVPDSGIYQNTTTGDRVTVNRGDPFPPTPGPGQSYRPVVLTDPKHQAGR